MDFSGRYEIPAPPQAVWDAINDPETLKVCIPGCEAVSKTDPTHFDAAARLKIGPVSATFRGKLGLDELDPPHRCVMRGEGQGGVAGFAKGEAEVRLEAVPEGTVLTYTAKANIGGKLAQVGQRLIASAAKQIADDFFGRLAHELGAPETSAPASAITQAALQAEAIAEAEMRAAGVSVETDALLSAIPPAGADIGAPARSTSSQGKGTAGGSAGVAPEIWVVGLVAVIIILLILFGLVL
ncbi:MAG: carbon monoxide dehydrogenase subunit G [Alphaproteobacteria bacterium]|nr:carbon monoxide dehydrogenase subunit G [Alphaproteobacteria bacterium]